VFNQLVTTVVIFWLLITSSLCYGEQGYIKTSHGNVWYKIVGTKTNKPPIVVIHGGPGGGSCGLDVLQKLATDRQVIFYDQLGSGKSPTHNDDTLWQLDRYVNELDQVLKILNVKRPIIIAHSWGAAIATKYLTSYKNDVRAIIFASPYVSSPLWIKDANYLMNRLPPNSTLSDYQKAHLQLYPNKPPHDIEMCQGSVWNDHIYKTMWGTSEFRVDGNLKAFDLYPSLSKITIPTLILIGDSDEVTVRTAKLYQRKIKHSRLIVIKKAAHMSMSDQPHTFVKVVKRFVDNCCN
jgi:proline iminopeptidase